MNSTQYLNHLIELSRDAFGAGVQTHQLVQLQTLLAQEKTSQAEIRSPRNEFR